MISIPSFLYKSVYLLIVAILTIIISMKYLPQNGNKRYILPNNDLLNHALVLFLILFIGFRPESGEFVDMLNYKLMYVSNLEGSSFHFSLDEENIIFDNLFSYWGANRLGLTSFFLLISAVYFGAAYMGISRLFPTHKLSAYLVFLAAFSTFSYGTNGIKAGAAASIFIWALGYRDNLKVCVPLVLLSWGFHHSMQLPVAAFILTMFYKKPKYYYYTWLFCFFVALFHVEIFTSLFASITDESGADYLVGKGDEADGTKGGFRIDFIIYSSVPIILGYILEMKRKIKVSPTYRDLIHLYICVNGIWMLCMYARFTNRIAYLSWFLYPIVLIYPFLNEDWGANKYKIFAKVMLCHLCFTLFMEFIYYSK